MKIFVQHTDSTNRIAREEAAHGVPSGTVIWAEAQDSGRGQYGRSFASPPGGLYFSLVLRPHLAPELVSLITLVTGLACRDVLFEMYTVDARIKWPNDLYIGEKKVGGILCENSFDSGVIPQQPTVIIGVGLNMNSRLSDFPLDLQALVTTVCETTGETVPLEQALDRFTQKITEFVASLPEKLESLLDRWQNYDYLLHRPVSYINGTQTIYGTGQGIAVDGRYSILDESGNKHVIIGGQLRPAAKDKLLK
ncbi:MAG: biotin--[acetyl-CoA-carboxylase] ligase [Desulfobulbus sp.]|nr:biotin--[acetyl-CoA-carboxylase] ligase [Desulfobulbus sp.]